MAKFSKETSAFDSGMRGPVKSPDTAKPKKGDGETAPLPNVFLSGMRGSEIFSEPTDSPTTDAPGPDDAEVQHVEAEAGLPTGKAAGTHNAAEVVSSDDTHYTVRLPKKLFLGSGKKK